MGTTDRRDRLSGGAVVMYHALAVIMLAWGVLLLAEVLLELNTGLAERWRWFVAGWVTMLLICGLMVLLVLPDLRRRAVPGGHAVTEARLFMLLFLLSLPLYGFRYWQWVRRREAG